MIRVELHDRSNTLVKVLSGARHAAYHPVLNSDGSAFFEIHRADPDVAALGILLQPPGGIQGYIVHLLRKGQYETAFTDRFSFVVEAVSFGLEQGEEQNAWITVAGRGTLSLLADRICWPPGFDGINASSITTQWQIYTGKSGGFIMDAELDRSASRFTPPITHSLQSSTILQAAKLRFDNLRLLHDALVQSGPMDAQMLGLDYQCVDVRGSDKSASVKVQLSAQDSLLGLQMASDASTVKNWIVAQGTGEGINSKLAVATDAPSITALRRREGFLDARQVDVQSQLALTAAGSLAQFKAVDQRITAKFIDSPAIQLYRDFDLGDFITLAAMPLSLSQKVRVVGYTIAETDAEVEDVSLDLNSMRTEYLIKLLQGTVAPLSGSLSVLNRLPQGAPYNDSFGFPDSADSTHPWRVKRFIPSNLLQLNYCKLSFSLGAFRSPVAAVNNPAVTSGASSAASSAGGSSHNHTTPNHAHAMFTITSAPGATNTTHYIGTGGQKVELIAETPATNINTDSSGGGSTSGAEGAHTHLIPHTHDVTSNVTLTYGIFEGASATNVLVLINGTDRTVALGGPGGGFTTDQAELEVSQWLTIGAWNTFELQPGTLGRLYADVRMTGYIQSA